LQDGYYKTRAERSVTKQHTKASGKECGRIQDYKSQSRDFRGSNVEGPSEGDWVCGDGPFT